MPLTRDPFGTETEDENQIYGEAVVFWLPDDDTPGQVNPVFAVSGLLDSNLHFVEWDGNERRVYLRTSNAFQQSLQDDAPAVPAAIVDALGAADKSMFTGSFSHAGIKVKFDSDGHASTLDGGIPVMSTRNAVFVPPSAGDSIQYLAYDDCRFIRASTVAKYRREFAEAYDVLFNDSNLDFAIDESIDACTPDRCTQCAESSCVIQELVNNPRISGASLTLEAIRMNYIRVVFNLSDEAFSRLRANSNDLTLDEILRMQCISDGFDARLYLEHIFAITDPLCAQGSDFSSLSDAEAIDFANNLKSGAIQPLLLCAEGPWFERILPESFCYVDFADSWYAELNFAAAYANIPFGWTWCISEMCIQIPMNNQFGEIIRRDARRLSAQAFDVAYELMINEFKDGNLNYGPEAENYFIQQFENQLAVVFSVSQNNVSVNRVPCAIPDLQGCSVVSRHFGRRIRHTGCGWFGEFEYID